MVINQEQAPKILKFYAVLDGIGTYMVVNQETGSKNLEILSCTG